jgi:predicted metal-binding membrane protein
VTAALVFLASAVGTVIWCGAMADMPGMAMPGGWVMSMAWMRMPGQSWAEAGAQFMGMWALMMVAMMLPVAMPMLARYRRALGTEPRVNALTLMVAVGYFAVWILAGAVVFPLGVGFAEWVMREPALSVRVPSAAGAAMLIAGALQFTDWKARQLECCAGKAEKIVSNSFAAAWRHGLKLGLRCNYCCASFTAILLVIGVMDLWAMAVVMTAISAERLLPASRAAARGFGALAIVVGLVMWSDALAG